MNTPWREVEPLPTLNGAVSPVLLTVDSSMVPSGRRTWLACVFR